MKLYTIGHSDLELSDFIRIMHEHKIGWIADVRSAPFSGRFPQFNRRSFTQELGRARIKYLYVGDKVGGKPPDDTAGEWTQGKLNYLMVSKLSDSNNWRSGIDLLQRAVETTQGGFGCLLCSEANPNACHRSLIAFDLENSMDELLVEHLTPKSPRTSVAFQKALLNVTDDPSHYH